MPYVMTGSKRRSNNDIVNWAYSEVSICFNAKNVLRALFCRAEVGLVKEQQEEKSMPK